ncbi:hypothetical protein WJX72_009731 [[Myrmecia] bisecta]|uniref:Uncharacterized protein n=1 Tax=[Myrmecia] bisecta TaxID=41462 RepID=A0AAW1QS16_9CHLO
MEEQACLKVSNVRALVTVLQAIKASIKQNCRLCMAADGVTVRWEDDSKSLQSSVFMRAGLFADYQLPAGRMEFGLTFSLLMDALNVFASGLGAELVLRYPGANSELVCEMTEAAEATTVCTYAQLNTINMPQAVDLSDSWQDPSSWFLMPGLLLKEALEDLEWAAAGGHVKLDMQRDSQRITISAESVNGEMRVELPQDSLAGFSCAQEQLQFSYKYKHMRTAFTHIPHQKETPDVSTKVTLDADGLMKVTHMMSMQSLHEQNISNIGSLPFSGGSQRGPGNSAVVQFLVLPEDDAIPEHE